MGIVAEADGGADGSPICGFASFVDAPLDPDSRELSDKAFLDWYRPHIEAAGASDADEARPGSVLWLAVGAANDSVAPQRVVIAAMMRAVFATLPGVDRVLTLLPPGLEPFAPLSPGAFVETVATTLELGGAAGEALAEAKEAEGEVVGGDAGGAATFSGGPASISTVSDSLSGYGVLECHRQRILPRLRVRHAMIEDHDDLAPVFDERSDVVSEAFGEFFLADVIESAAEARAACLHTGGTPATVALVGLSPVDDRAVALLVTTAEPDVDTLAQGYDLEAFDGLRRHTPQAKVALEAELREGARQRRDWLTTMTTHVGELTEIFHDAASEQSPSGDAALATVAEEWDGERSAGIEGDEDGDAAVMHCDAGSSIVPAASLKQLCGALDSAGRGWGYEGPCGVGLGEVMLLALQGDAARADEGQRLVAAEARAVLAAAEGGSVHVALEQEVEGARPAWEGATLRKLTGEGAVLTQTQFNTAVEAFRASRTRQQRRLRLATLWRWAGPEDASTGAEEAEAEGSDAAAGDQGAARVAVAFSGARPGAPATEEEAAAAEAEAAAHAAMASSYVGEAVQQEAEALLAAVREDLERRAAEERSAREAAAKEAEERRRQAMDSDEDEDDEEDVGGSGGVGPGASAGGSSHKGPAEAALSMPLRVPVADLAGTINERAADEQWPWAWVTGMGGALHGPGQDLMEELEALAVEAGAAGAAAAGGVPAAAGTGAVFPMTAGSVGTGLPEPVGAARGMDALTSELSLGGQPAALLGDVVGLAHEGAGEVTAERFADVLALWNMELAEAGASRVVIVGPSGDACRVVGREAATAMGVPLIDVEAESKRLAAEDEAREERLAEARLAELRVRQEAATKAAKKKKAKKPTKEGKKKKKGAKVEEEERPPDLTLNLDRAIDESLLPPAPDSLVGPMRWLARRLQNPDCGRGYVLVNWSMPAETLRELAKDKRRPPLTAATAPPPVPPKKSGTANAAAQAALAQAVAVSDAQMAEFRAATDAAAKVEAEAEAAMLATVPAAVSPSMVAMILAQTGCEPTLVVVAAPDADAVRASGLAMVGSEPGMWASVAPVIAVQTSPGGMTPWESAGLRSALVAAGAVGLLEDAEAHSEALADEARQVAEEAGPGPINAFAVALLGSAPEWDSRVADMLPAAFDAMPDLEYAVLSLPHAATTPLLAGVMVAVDALPGCTLAQRVFVAHRASLPGPTGLDIRPARTDDRLAVLRMAQGTATAVPLLRAVVAAAIEGEAATAAASAHGRLGDQHLPAAVRRQAPASRAFVVEAEGQVVGAATVTNAGCSDAALLALRQSFLLDDLCDVEAAGGASVVAALEHLSLNPLFASPECVRHVLSQLMLQTGRRVLLHRAEDVDDVEAGAGEEDRATASRGVDPTAAAATAPQGSFSASASMADLAPAHVEKGPVAFAEVALSELLRVQPAAPPLPLEWANNSGKAVASQPPDSPAGGSGGADVWRENPRALCHPLFVQSRRLLTEPRTTIGARIVLVGASDCGLAAVARLRAAPHLRLSNITVINPGGLRARRLDGAAGLLSAFGADRARAETDGGSGAPALGRAPLLCHEELRRLGLTASAPDLTTIDGVVVGIGRDTRTVTLHDGSRVPYDILALTPGLTESTAKSLGWASPSRPGVVVASGTGAGARLVAAVGELLDAVPNSHTEAAARQAQAAGTRGPTGVGAADVSAADADELRVGVDAGRDVVVWGDGLAAVTALRALTDRGVDAARILMIRREAKPSALALGSGADNEVLFAEDAPADGPATVAEGADCVSEEFDAWLARSDVEVMWGWRVVRVTETDALDEGTRRPRLLLGLQTGGGPQISREASVSADESVDASAEIAMTEEERLELEEMLDEIEDEDERERRRLEALRAARLTAAGLRDISLDCRLLVCGDRDDVDPVFFQAVNACGLVYDGRLVVDHRFTTTDANIVAAGRVAKFSRRFRARRLLQEQNAVEVGELLGVEVLAKVDPVTAALAAEEEEARRAFAEAVGADSSGTRGSSMLPAMTRPVIALACLPGGRWLLRAALPRFEVNPGGRVLTTRVRASDTGASTAQEETDAETEAGVEETFGDRLVRSVVDRHGRLAEVGVLAPSAVAALNLSRVVGLPMAWLRDLERDLRAGRTRDLVWQLEQPWAAIVLHHEFAAEVERAREAMRGDEGADESMPREVLDYVQSALERVKGAGAMPAAADEDTKEQDKEDGEEQQEEVGRRGAAKATPSHPEAQRLQLLGTGAAKVPLEVRRALELRTIRFLRARRAALPRFFIPGIH